MFLQPIPVPLLKKLSVRYAVGKRYHNIIITLTYTTRWAQGQNVVGYHCQTSAGVPSKSFKVSRFVIAYSGVRLPLH